MTEFKSDVYEAIRRGAIASAARLADRLVWETQHPARGVERPALPLQVLDVGCGEGWWSAALAAHDAVGEVISIDQAVPDVTAPGVTVQTLDLERPWSLVGEPFDLVVCLEVGEHLSPRGGDRLVESIARATRPNGRIIWSAAIPGQGGHGHVNEQWPAYWDERFRASGWMLADVFRDSIWDLDDVEPWYRQNLLAGVSPAANGTAWAMHSHPRSLVHPAIWDWRRADVAYWRSQALACAESALAAIKAADA